jgi:hypothetical protein
VAQSKKTEKQDDQPNATPEQESEHLAKLQQLVTRARAGDDAVLPHLRQLLEHSTLWHEIGDMARHAQDSWLTLIAGKDHFVKESIRKSLAEFRKELDEPNSSRLERLLIERVVACWLYVQFAEIQVAAGDKLPIVQRRFYGQQLDSANRQFLNSTKQLIALRALLPKLDKSRCPAAFLQLPEPTSNGNGRTQKKPHKENGQPVNRLVAVPAEDDE